MALQRRLDELHALSFSDLESAVDAASRFDVLADLFAHPQLSPLANHFVLQEKLSPAYLEFVFRLLELVEQHKYDPRLYDVCLLIYNSVFSKLGVVPKPNDESFTLATLQRIDPALNIKLVRPRCMNDVLALLGSERAVFPLVGLFFGPVVFYHSPAALRYKYAAQYLRAVQALDLSCIGARQAFQLRSDNYSCLCQLCPHYYCAHITGRPEEIAGALKGLSELRQNQALCGPSDTEQYLYQYINRLLKPAAPKQRELRAGEQKGH